MSANDYFEKPPIFLGMPEVGRGHERVEPDEQLKERWRDLLREIPVSINNMYGDPVLQWQNTVEKMDALLESGHRGPVGIIMKGGLSDAKVEDLRDRYEAGLRVVNLVSISELGSIEKVGHAHRYENLRKLTEAGLPTIAYVRPLIPPHNTDEVTLTKMFDGITESGCNTVVVSGFRGDESMVQKMSPDPNVDYVMRVKVMPPEVYETVKRLAEERGVQLFTRTACAVAAVTGETTPYNPYYNSPNLVKCKELNCPLQATCGPAEVPREGSVEMLQAMGFDVEFKPGENGRKLCGVSGADRLKCPSCCTTCYFTTGIPHIEVRGESSLGDLSFIRFVTGMMAMQNGCRDTGDQNVGGVNFPKFPEVAGAQALNSWWPIARNMDKCFGCEYCVVSEYYTQNVGGNEVGFTPADLIDRMYPPKEER